MSDPGRDPRREKRSVRQIQDEVNADIVRMMLGDGLRMIAAGLALGLLGSLWFARGLRSMLYHISDADPSTLAPVAAVLAIVAVVAVLIPALRSSRVDPMGVLRHD